jgi:hypothetical protein
MLKPSMRKYPMQSPENIRQMLDTCPSFVHSIPSTKTQPARKDLLTRHNVRRPIKRVAAIINRTTALGRFVHSAQELPFAGAHFWAGGGGTGWVVKEKADDEVVAFVY